jgi:hypothetical protein
VENLERHGVVVAAVGGGRMWLYPPGGQPRQVHVSLADLPPADPVELSHQRGRPPRAVTRLVLSTGVSDAWLRAEVTGRLYALALADLAPTESARVGRLAAFDDLARQWLDAHADGQLAPDAVRAATAQLARHGLDELARGPLTAAGDRLLRYLVAPDRLAEAEQIAQRDAVREAGEQAAYDADRTGVPRRIARLRDELRRTGDAGLLSRFDRLVRDVDRLGVVDLGTVLTQLRAGTDDGSLASALARLDADERRRSLEGERLLRDALAALPFDIGIDRVAASRARTEANAGWLALADRLLAAEPRIGPTLLTAAVHAAVDLALLPGAPASVEAFGHAVALTTAEFERLVGEAYATGGYASRPAVQAAVAAEVLTTGTVLRPELEQRLVRLWVDTPDADRRSADSPHMGPMTGSPRLRVTRIRDHVAHQSHLISARSSIEQQAMVTRVASELARLTIARDGTPGADTFWYVVERVIRESLKVTVVSRPDGGVDLVYQYHSALKEGAGNRDRYRRIVGVRVGTDRYWNGEQHVHNAFLRDVWVDEELHEVGQPVDPRVRWKVKPFTAHPELGHERQRRAPHVLGRPDARGVPDALTAALDSFRFVAVPGEDGVTRARGMFFGETVLFDVRVDVVPKEAAHKGIAVVKVVRDPRQPQAPPLYQIQIPRWLLRADEVAQRTVLAAAVGGALSEQLNFNVENGLGEKVAPGYAPPGHEDLEFLASLHVLLDELRAAAEDAGEPVAPDDSPALRQRMDELRPELTAWMEETWTASAHAHAGMRMELIEDWVREIRPDIADLASRVLERMWRASESTDYREEMKNRVGRDRMVAWGRDEILGQLRNRPDPALPVRISERIRTTVDGDPTIGSLDDPADRAAQALADIIEQQIGPPDPDQRERVRRLGHFTGPRVEFDYRLPNGTSPRIRFSIAVGQLHNLDAHTILPDQSEARLLYRVPIELDESLPLALLPMVLEGIFAQARAMADLADVGRRAAVPRVLGQPHDRLGELARKVPTFGDVAEFGPEDQRLIAMIAWAAEQLARPDADHDMHLRLLIALLDEAGLLGATAGPVQMAFLDAIRHSPAHALISELNGRLAHGAEREQRVLRDIRRKVLAVREDRTRTRAGPEPPRYVGGLGHRRNHLAAQFYRRLPPAIRLLSAVSLGKVMSARVNRMIESPAGSRYAVFVLERIVGTRTLHHNAARRLGLVFDAPGDLGVPDLPVIPDTLSGTLGGWVADLVLPSDLPGPLAFGEPHVSTAVSTLLTTNRVRTTVRGARGPMFGVLVKRGGGPGPRVIPLVGDVRKSPVSETYSVTLSTIANWGHRVPVHYQGHGAVLPLGSVHFGPEATATWRFDIEETDYERLLEREVGEVELMQGAGEPTFIRGVNLQAEYGISPNQWGIWDRLAALPGLQPLLLVRPNMTGTTFIGRESGGQLPGSGIPEFLARLDEGGQPPVRRRLHPGTDRPALPLPADSPAGSDGPTGSGQPDSWASTVGFLRQVAASSVDQPASQLAAVVRSAWDAQSRLGDDAGKDTAIGNEPGIVGRMPGVPFEDRYVANSTNLANQLAALDGSDDAEVAGALRQLATDLEGDPDRHLLRLDFAPGRSQLVEVHGDVALADHVVLLVPGADSSITGHVAYGAERAKLVYRAANVDPAAGRTAVIAWAGDVAPVAAGDAAANRRTARSAQELESMLAAVSVEAPGTSLTIVAEQEGSVVVGEAVRTGWAEAGHVVLVGDTQRVVVLPGDTNLHRLAYGGNPALLPRARVYRTEDPPFAAGGDALQLLAQVVTGAELTGEPVLAWRRPVERVAAAVYERAVASPAGDPSAGSPDRRFERAGTPSREQLGFATRSGDPAVLSTLDDGEVEALRIALADAERAANTLLIQLSRVEGVAAGTDAAAYLPDLAWVAEQYKNRPVPHIRPAVAPRPGDVARIWAAGRTDLVSIPVLLPAGSHGTYFGAALDGMIERLGEAGYLAADPLAPPHAPRRADLARTWRFGQLPDGVSLPLRRGPQAHPFELRLHTAEMVRAHLVGGDPTRPFADRLAAVVDGIRAGRELDKELPEAEPVRDGGYLADFIDANLDEWRAFLDGDPAAPRLFRRIADTEQGRLLNAVLSALETLTADDPAAQARYGLAPDTG